jgi:hypothetical protein
MGWVSMANEIERVPFTHSILDFIGCFEISEKHFEDILKWAHLNIRNYERYEISIYLKNEAGYNARDLKHIDGIVFDKLKEISRVELKIFVINSSVERLKLDYRINIDHTHVNICVQYIDGLRDVSNSFSKLILSQRSWYNFIYKNKIGIEVFRGLTSAIFVLTMYFWSRNWISHNAYDFKEYMPFIMLLLTFIGAYLYSILTILTVTVFSPCIFRYGRIQEIELQKEKFRRWILGSISFLLLSFVAVALTG